MVHQLRLTTRAGRWTFGFAETGIMEFAELFKSWSEKELKASDTGKRLYAHFDPKLKFKRNQKFFENFLSKPENIAKHGFYPLIKDDIITWRYKKVELTGGGYERKKVKKPRPIAYAAHLDAFIYSWYSHLLTELYHQYTRDHGFEDCVLAYLEKGESNIEFAKEIIDHVKGRGSCVTMAFDISSFFDGLDHEILKRNWQEVLGEPRLPEDHFKIFRSLTNYTFVQKASVLAAFPLVASKIERKEYVDRFCTPSEFRSEIRGKGLIEKNPFKNEIKGSARNGEMCGIPQGSPISACLSNIYMLEFDQAMKKEVEAHGGIYRRYSDDIMIVCDWDKYPMLKDFVQKEILKYELVINDDKTDITGFARHGTVLKGVDVVSNKPKKMQYLGFEFDGQRTYIRSSSMSRYHTRMKARIRENLKAAYGRRSLGTHVFKKKFLNRYSEKGERNFHWYANRAIEIMDSESIRKQTGKSQIKALKVFHKKKQKFEDKLMGKGRLRRRLS